MKRNVDLKEISDGRLYSSGDMVRADCRDCEGCSECCRGMGSSIILDPMDVWRLQKGIKKGFQALLEEGKIELNMADGMILPNLKMDAEREACPFLDGQGRCSVHDCRPGLCRLFPLGRYYEENGFRYFIQIHECRKQDRGKIKIKKWLGIPNLKAYENYILEWHGFLNQCEDALETLSEENVRILELYVLRRFYETAYMAADENGFYEEFSARMEEVKEKFGFK
ncbi:MAG TPA: YkgJ family cysteine cluster protein [Candidatus Mediterraneibacter tabaqchaliae]|uniref:YkgJ family cysteine cluster protein n=1 Tax=Candidatus Mediterraneibacter tabaqchaliae TaxID=2838689 RepID=A0A9D2R0H2_9FIRM|nr:YkgJ family cysteine cluster protein [Candidatus Mediterraneibacter tabaqchaliae]